MWSSVGVALVTTTRMNNDYFEMYLELSNILNYILKYVYYKNSLLRSLAWQRTNLT